MSFRPPLRSRDGRMMNATAPHLMFCGATANLFPLEVELPLPTGCTVHSLESNQLPEIFTT